MYFLNNYGVLIKFKSIISIGKSENLELIIGRIYICIN